MSPPRWKNRCWLMSVDEKGSRFGYAQAVFDDAEPISVVIEETGEGKYRVDWESSVSYGELDWKEFLKVRQADPTLPRVIAPKSCPLYPPVAADQPTTSLPLVRHYISTTNYQLKF